MDDGSNIGGSFDCMKWAEDQHVGNVGMKATLMALARFAGLTDDSWGCFPGQARLAKGTEQGARTIRRQVAEMAERGLLCHRPRMRVGGRGRTSDQYFLHVGERCGECGWVRNAPGLTGHIGQVVPDQPAAHADQPATGGTTNRPAMAEEVPENYQRELPVRKVGRSRSLPADFEISTSMRAWASEHVPSVDVDLETDQWRDYHLARGKPANDWVASWRTWMRNAGKWSKSATGGGFHRETEDEAWDRMAAEDAENRAWVSPTFGQQPK